MQGYSFRVQVSNWVLDSGFESRVQGVQGFGFRIRVQGAECKVGCLGCGGWEVGVLGNTQTPVCFGEGFGTGRYSGGDGRVESHVHLHHVQVTSISISSMFK